MEGDEDYESRKEQRHIGQATLWRAIYGDAQSRILSLASVGAPLEGTSIAIEDQSR